MAQLLVSMKLKGDFQHFVLEIFVQHNEFQAKLVRDHQQRQNKQNQPRKKTSNVIER